MLPDGGPGRRFRHNRSMTQDLQSAPGGLSEAERASLQRKTLLVLSAASAAGRAAMSIAFVVVTLLAQRLLGGPAWAGAASAAITVGTALSSSWLSARMAASGRRPGLVLGYMAAIVGAVIAGFGGQIEFFVVYLVGLVLFGIGQGSTGLARYAAADLSPPAKTGRAISYVVFASTAGAVGGPMLSDVASGVGTSFGWDELVGAFIFATGFFVLAAAVLFVFLRPDPLLVSTKGQPVPSKRATSLAVGLRAATSSRRASLALAGLVISQAVMVMVMTMTPVHMDQHDKPIGLIGWVLSVHTAGMFAFAPLAGWFSDKYGRVQSIAVGGVVLAVATVITAFASDAASTLMFPGLYLLGLGWSFGEVGSSALLTESVSDGERVAAQGAGDLVKAFVSGAAALASGFVFTASGFGVLSWLGVLCSVGLLVGCGSIGRGRASYRDGTSMTAKSDATTTSE